jgi:dimethylhistidine N-methyltransferase
MRTSPVPRRIASADALTGRFQSVRRQSLELARPLTPEDQCVQSMPDTSPTKWHLAHTTWFFETFILVPQAPGYEVFHPRYNYLFNSYYEQVGPRHARPKRGLLTRPALADIHAYRAHVDEAMAEFLATGPNADVRALIELGLHHEQQHQELLVTDIKHVLGSNPLFPAYRPPFPREAKAVVDLDWIDFPGGLVEIGWDGETFAFDCEGPRHRVWLEPYRLASRPTTNAEYMAFMADGGYARPEFWLSDGWATVQANAWEAPLHWHRDDDGEWRIFTLSGLRPIEKAAPVCHVSYFEADAFARWAGKRLATEAEWENAAKGRPLDGHFAGKGVFHPLPASDDGLTQMFGDVWEWTKSPYVAYPGFSPAPGAVGEYNGKFMSGQMVLRGGSCATPEDHIRATYRNFFYMPDRWQFTGIRLADDAPKAAKRPAATSSPDGDIAGGSFLDDVLAGLATEPKGLKPKYFYDAAGSALFNQICRLPEYYPTRTEEGILAGHAADMAEAIGSGAVLIEYGAGSLDKVRLLLDRLRSPAALVAVDISEAHLLAAARDLDQAYPDLTVLPVAADFTQAFALPPLPKTATRKVAFFPGSTIGNFEPDAAVAFLCGVADTVGAGGGLLIGVDLKKDVGLLLKAYDDDAGVTAAFNKNLLERINRELGADFDAARFRHVARYNQALGRIEMHLESMTDQTVTVAGHAFDFAAGETIHTENSYKFAPDEFDAMAAAAGFTPEARWTDADVLFQVVFYAR